MGHVEFFLQIHTPYEKYPFLEDYREFFGDLSENQILGEGNYGIIIGGLGDNKIYKIGKSSQYSQELRREYKNHEQFYLAIQKLPKDFQKILRVPEVSIAPREITNQQGETLFIYEMEKVDGISLMRHDMYNAYAEKLAGLNGTLPENDKELIDILEESNMFQEDEIALIYSRGITILKDNFPLEGNKIQEAIDILRSQGFEHLDLHSRNILISFDSENKVIVYMIDFGLATTPEISQ